MRPLLVAVFALVLAACGGHAAPVVVPLADALDWESNVGATQVVRDEDLVARVREAAAASRARALDVTVVAVAGRHVPVVTLQVSDPAAYLEHRLDGFLREIGYLRPGGLGFVQLVDKQGRFAWSAGRWTNGGMVHPRPDLDGCGPIAHHGAGLNLPPPCPAA